MAKKRISKLIAKMMWLGKDKNTLKLCFKLFLLFRFVIFYIKDEKSIVVEAVGKN